MNASDSRPAHANTAERRTILDAIPVIAWCTLPDGSNEFVNQRWQDYTGIPADEARGQGWQEAVHPEDLSKLSEKWAEIVASGKSGEFEGRLRRHDGAFRWVLARFEPVRDDTGEIVRWYGTSTDIDALKQAEEKLREDERALRRITDTIPQNIVVLDPDGIPIYANRATLDYTGLTLADVVSSDFRARVFHPEDLERVRDQRQAALAAGVPFEFELRACSKEGQYRWFLTRYHSYGGTVITAAGTDERVAGLVYIAALAPDDGETSQSQQNQFPVTDIFSHIDIADGRVWMLPKGIACFAGDLSEVEQKVVWATHAAPAADLFNQKVEGTAWKSKPSWHIVVRNDRTVQPELQRFVAKRMGATIYEMDGSHVPMLSNPGLVIDVIRTAANAVQRSTIGA
jgi:PAS domain S-box-containing protein